jgi:sterol 3beta-glucosyltransferase
VGADPIPRKKLTAERLALAIREVRSNPEIQQNASRLGEKIRQEDGLAEAAKWIERYWAPSGQSSRPRRDKVS